MPANAGIRTDAAVITHWNEIAVRTIFTENNNPVPSSGLYFGFTSIAVYDAVVAINGGYRPYLRQPRADRRASVEAAAATAAHDVLAHYYPASAANLATDLAATLATVPDGHRKVAGQRAGATAAARLIQEREGDGRNAMITLDVPPACVTGAAVGTFAYLFGARSINLDVSSSVTSTTRHYDTAEAWRMDAFHARIWLGFHFRKAMTDGSYIGLYSSAWVRSREFTPAR